MRPETDAGLEEKFDFSDEEPTHPDQTTMHVLMQSMMDEEHDSIVLATTDRPTRPIRPMVRWNEREEESGG